MHVTLFLTHGLVDPFESVTSGQYGPIKNTSFHTLKLMGNKNSEFLFRFFLQPNFTYSNLSVLILDCQNITNLENMASLVQGKSSLEEITLDNADQISNLGTLKKIFFTDKKISINVYTEKGGIFNTFSYLENLVKNVEGSLDLKDPRPRTADGLEAFCEGTSMMVFLSELAREYDFKCPPVLGVQHIWQKLGQKLIPMFKEEDSESENQEFQEIEEEYPGNRRPGNNQGVLEQEDSANQSSVSASRIEEE